MVRNDSSLFETNNYDIVNVDEALEKKIKEEILNAVA